MKIQVLTLAISCARAFSTLAAEPHAERYIVSFPEKTGIEYHGAFAGAFPNGLPVGIGSALLFTGKVDDALTFSTVTDREPNVELCVRPVPGLPNWLKQTSSLNWTAESLSKLISKMQNRICWQSGYSFRRNAIYPSVLPYLWML